MCMTQTTGTWTNTAQHWRSSRDTWARPARMETSLQRQYVTGRWINWSAQKIREIARAAWQWPSSTRN
eukprot:9913269-Ditylum_brightwellii.AAC.1